MNIEVAELERIAIDVFRKETAALHEEIKFLKSEGKCSKRWWKNK